MIRMILAINNECFIGKDNKLMYRLKDDMLNFKTMTQGGIVVMGRKTFQSLKSALPNRTNYVITNDPTSIDHPSEFILTPEQFKEEFLPHHKVSNDNVWIIGGAQVYETATPFTSEIICTFVDDDEEGDVALPPKLFGSFVCTATLQTIDVDEDNDKPYEIVQLLRREDVEHAAQQLMESKDKEPNENGGLKVGDAFIVAATTSADKSQVSGETLDIDKGLCY